MAKVVLMMTRKAGMSMADFKHYYETSHAPLAKRLMGEYMLDYRRNFRSEMLLAEWTPNPDQHPFDVVTEIWYKDEATLRAMWEKAREPDIARQIDEDGRNFTDPTLSRFYIVDEEG